MPGFTRRRLVGYGIGAGAALVLPWPARAGAAAPARKLARYVDRLPVPGDGIVVARPSAPGAYAFAQRPIARKLHRDLPPTPLWAYDDGSGLAGQAGSFGLVVAAQRGQPLDVTYRHQLPATYPSWLPVDERLTPFGREVRVMAHLHGGLVDEASDGNPAATPQLYRPRQTQRAHYPNEQAASLVWFHDHGLGTTRLNVLAGLAAAYVLRDQFDTGAPDNPNGLPAGAYEIPLVVQDRLLAPDGTLRYPVSTIPGVTWVGEYFGDVMLVNGKAWPYLDVEPRLYRFRVLNGCNARILNLSFGGARVWQIGGDGGLWDRPVPVGHLVLAGAERADVLVDFSRLAGQHVQLVNSPAPPPVTSPAPPLPQVMRFRVAATAAVRSAVPTALAGGVRADLPAPRRRRFITLNEVGIDTAAWRLTLNGLGFMDGAATETPRAGDIEDWCYINLTGDTHPLHTHLVSFQVVARVPFDVAAYQAAAPSGPGGSGGIDPAPFATGPARPPEPTERGFKDTVQVHPGQFTVIRARFSLPPGVTRAQRYVHHCHILEHEDNDMMRPFVVTP